MDRLSRLIVLVLLALCAISSRAAEPVEWFYTPVLNPDQGGAKRTMEEACRATAAIYGWTYQGVQRTSADRWYCGMSPGGSDGYVIMRCQDGTMPAPGGGPNGTCADPEPQKTCPVDVELLPLGTMVAAGSNLTARACVDGCVVSGLMGSVRDGVNYISGPIVTTGASCNMGSDGIPPARPVSNSCKAGQCPGTVNGQSVCVKCSSSTSSSKTKESTSTAETPASGASSASSSSGTKTSETTCTGDKCTTTTTTTTTNSDGSKKEQTTTVEQPKNEFCQLNPSSPQCKGDESSWGGTCQSGAFSCDGDAVQCAQAQAAWKSYCEAHVDPSSEWVTKGQAAMRGEGESPHGGSQSFSLGAFTSGRVIGPSGGCPADVTVSLAGTSFTLPFSEYCGVLNAIGLAGNALSMVIAVGIVFGRKGAA